MEQKIKTFGRSELAQLYFPTLLQKSAWQKLKSWLMLNPDLRSLAMLPRRTFTPAEVQLIYTQLGEPWKSATYLKKSVYAYSVESRLSLNEWLFLLSLVFLAAILAFWDFGYFAKIMMHNIGKEFTTKSLWLIIIYILLLIIL